jgi:hypothetical protein
MKTYELTEFVAAFDDEMDAADPKVGTVLPWSLRAVLFLIF